MEIFGKIVNNLSTLNNIDLKDIVLLGKNHYDYGVRPSDFEVEYFLSNFKIFK